jgi:predicted MFS family arabinose efflux permease
MASVVLPNAIGILLAAALLGGTFMGQTALGVMRGRELAFGDPRRAIAVLTGAFGVGQIIGPIFAGAAFDRYGSFTLPSCAAAVGLVVAAVLANIRTR